MIRRAVFCIAVLLFSGNGFAQGADIRWLRDIHLNRNTRLDGAMKGISLSVYPLSIGAPLVQFVSGAVANNAGLKNKGLELGAGAAGAAIVTLGVKYAVNRDRPYVTYPDIQAKAKEFTPSFPSGHSSAAFQLATGLLMQKQKWYVVAPAYSWAAGVAYSRMHLGVHYPSDVAVGAAFGCASAWLAHKINKKIQGRQPGR